MPIRRGRAKAAVAVALLAALFALLARWESARHFITGEDSSCHFSSQFDCDKVLSSEYASLAGVSVASLAAAGMAILAVWLWRAQAGSSTALRLSGVLAAFSFVCAVAFFVVATFVIGATCLYCGLIQVCCLALAILVLPPAWRARGAGRLDRRTAGGLGLTAALILLVAAAGDAYTDRRSEFLRLHARPEQVAMRIDSADALILGEPESPISVLIYFDFGCPYCKRCYGTIRKLLKRHPDSFHAIFKHYPLDAECNAGGLTQHPGACRAAYAGQAAVLKGKTKVAMSKIFDLNRFYPQVLAGLAGDLGLDEEEWRSELNSKRAKAIVQRDIGEGIALGFTQVPMVFVNGRYVDPRNLERRLVRLMGE